MAYRLKPTRSVTHEIRRIADTQIALALHELRRVGTRSADSGVHEARRRIKKVRALLRLVAPALGARGTASNGRLRTASRLLGPVADGEAVVDTVDRLARRSRRVGPDAALALTRGLRSRETRIDRKADRDRVLAKATAILRRERSRIPLWVLNVHGSDAIAPGFERTVRRMHRAAARARRSPTAANYHTWRRRTKDVWLHTRLLDARCGGSLCGIERRLERLDGCLGEYHNVVLLERILMSEPMLSRSETARCLAALRRYQHTLRQQADVRARALADHKPRRFARRVVRLWHRTNARSRVGRIRSATWPRAA